MKKVGITITSNHKNFCEGEHCKLIEIEVEDIDEFQKLLFNQYTNVERNVIENKFFSDGTPFVVRKGNYSEFIPTSIEYLFRYDNDDNDWSTQEWKIAFGKISTSIWCCLNECYVYKLSEWD